MTTHDIDPQLIGGLVANVQTLLTHQQEVKKELAQHREATREDLVCYQEKIRLQIYDSNKRIFEKLDTLDATVGLVQVTLAGMRPVCEQHEKDIKKLQERPGRLVEIGSAAVSAVAAIAAWFVVKGH